MVCRLEEATGLAFRFVIGRTKENWKMSELQKEVAKYDDFLLLDIEEQYNKLPFKTLVRVFLMLFLNNQFTFVGIVRISSDVTGWPSSKLLMHCLIVSSMSRLMMTYI